MKVKPVLVDAEAQIGEDHSFITLQYQIGNEVFVDDVPRWRIPGKVIDGQQVRIIFKPFSNKALFAPLPVQRWTQEMVDDCRAKGKEMFKKFFEV